MSPLFYVFSFLLIKNVLMAILITHDEEKRIRAKYGV